MSLVSRVVSSTMSRQLGALFAIAANFSGARALYLLGDCNEFSLIGRGTISSATTSITSRGDRESSCTMGLMHEFMEAH